MKRIIYLLITGVMLTACQKECYTGPEVILTGQWRLEKIESPSRTLYTKDLGYQEVLKFSNDGSYTYIDKFMDGKKVDNLRFPTPIKEKKENSGDKYVEATIGGRFMKIYVTNGLMLTSDLLYKESPDTVRYYYYSL